MSPQPHTWSIALLSIVVLLCTGCSGTDEVPRLVSSGPASGELGVERVIATDGNEVEAICIFAAPQAVPGASGKPGSQANPLPSLLAGLQVARQFRLEGKPVCLRLLPGIYREECPEVLSDLDATASALVIEGASDGRSVISGSEVWNDWTLDQQTGIYSRSWPHAWGFSGIDYSGRNAPIGQRREMVFVNGRRLVQVLGLADLAQGRFLVDEQAKRILLKPPLGLDRFDQALVEVALRGEKALLRARSVSNLAIRRLTFVHAASAQREAPLFIMRSARILLEDITVLDSNWTGIKVDGPQAGAIRNCLVRGVGAMGLALGHARDFRVERVVAEDNCWRAQLGGLTGWDAAGVKCGSLDGVVFDRVESSGNLTHGIWLDTNVTRVELRDCRVERNLGHGIYLEKNLGPISLERCTIAGNQGGVMIVNTSGVTIADSRLLDNHEAQIIVNARSSYPKHTHWLTGEDIKLDLSNTVLQRNAIYGRNEYRNLIRTMGDKTMLSRFATTLTAAGNAYSCASAEAAFDLMGTKTGFAGWRKLTAQDADSTFTTAQASEELDR